jgi:hypothetical protein
LAEEIEKAFTAEVELAPGEFHSFDVLVDDTVIFSKFEEQRLPETAEVIERIQAYLDQD